MKPKRYPYSGQKKKQSDKQIAKLESKLTACEQNILILAARINVIDSALTNFKISDSTNIY